MSTHKSHFDQSKSDTREHFQKMGSFDVSLFESERNIPRYRNVYVLEMWIFPSRGIDWEEYLSFSLFVGIFKWLRGRGVIFFSQKIFQQIEMFFFKKFWYQVSIVRKFFLGEIYLKGIFSPVSNLFFLMLENKFNDRNFFFFLIIWSDLLFLYLWGVKKLYAKYKNKKNKINQDFFFFFYRLQM